MLEVYSRAGAGNESRAHGHLRLPFDLRQKSRLRATLESGEEVAVLLGRGEVMRGGDRLLTRDGKVIEVVAAPEGVLHVECDSPEALARIAYHLGNRHVPIQVGAGWLRFASDRVLEKMVAAHGARITALEAPFEPEAGAYAPHHRHDNESGHGGRIHEFPARP